MKVNKSKRNNIFLLGLLVLLIVPQTRLPIQVFFNKGLALFSPSIISKEKQTTLSNYNWELKDLNGSNFNLKRTKGKVVLINFWATWCPPCIAEMSSMESLYIDYKEKVDFVFVSNESSKTIREFLNKKQYTFNVYKADMSPPKIFDVSSIPRTFLIDQKGNIIIDKTGASNWNSSIVRETIDSLLN